MASPKLQAHLTRVKAEKEDSDLSNLAHALLRVETHEAALKDLRERIEQAAELPPERRDVSVIRKLYDEAMRLTPASNP